jgi:rod shape-determining protein MreC
MEKRSSFKIIVVFSLAIFFMVLNPYNFFAPVRSFFSSIFMPLIQVGYLSGNKVGDFLDTLKSIGTLKQDNENLNEENLELKFKINELKDIANENEQLRKELDIETRKDLNLLGAEVVFKDISGKNGWIEIDRGSADGLAKDMPIVVGGKNLVGFVDEVFTNYSRVRLINHPESVVNVVTIESNVEAIAKGEYGISVVVEKINQDAKVEPGMTFVTSQISGKFPRGLSVGVVQNVSSSQGGLFKNARIMSLVDFSKIRFVFVVMGEKK